VSDCVVDTMVLQKANAPILREPREGRLFLRRISLLVNISNGTIRPIVSAKLLVEYVRNVPSPRNEYIRAFFELLDRPERVIWNWARRWSGAERGRARACRYPREDDHLLRTAVGAEGSEILTEERRVLCTDRCVHREFGVHIRYLP